MLKNWLVGVGHGDAPDAETGRFVEEQATVSAIICEEIFLNFSRKFQYFEAKLANS
ncbi:MAG: hypothetical protein F6K39_34245 [Okeania sp. SIO3B3]|nr:hypothetical protein [Okeania sp. SIO3B3]